MRNINKLRAVSVISLALLLPLYLVVVLTMPPVWVTASAWTVVVVPLVVSQVMLIKNKQ